MEPSSTALRHDWQASGVTEEKSGPLGCPLFSVPSPFYRAYGKAKNPSLPLRAHLIGRCAFSPMPLHLSLSIFHPFRSARHGAAALQYVPDIPEAASIPSHFLKEGQHGPQDIPRTPRRPRISPHLSAAFRVPPLPASLPLCAGE